MTSLIPKGNVGEERYGIALVLLMSVCVFIMAAPEGPWARVVIIALEGLALVSSTRAAQAGMRIRVASAVLAILALMVALAAAILGFGDSSAYVNGTSVILVAVATPVITIGIVRQVKVNKRVTVHTMLGVLCIYLLMTLAFASLFGMIGDFSSTPFFTEGDSYSGLRDYLYFSITTITTLGIGDFTPNTDLARSLTAAESLIGQIYLVTVVAVIVGNLRPKN